MSCKKIILRIVFKWQLVYLINYKDLWYKNFMFYQMYKQQQQHQQEKICIFCDACKNNEHTDE